MESKEIIEKIKEYIAKGKTEKALETLVHYTKENKLPIHDEAILLSGQYSQWKRENMLGVEQSHSELRRIEMTIMDMLQDSKDTYKSSSVRQSKTSQSSDVPSSPSSKINTPMAVGGVIAILAIALGIWYFTSNSGGQDPNNLAGENQIENTSTQPTADNQSPAAGNDNISGAASPSPLSLQPGQELEVDKAYYTANGDYYLMFQADGNVVVKTTKENSFRWGSMQAGAGQERIPSRVILQDDGNFVLYDASDSFIWGTMTTVPGSTLAITNHGNLQVVAPDGRIVWESTQ